MERLVGVPPAGAEPDEVFRIAAADGTGLRAAVWRARKARAHLLFMPGRTETLEKAALSAAGFVARGISVASLDWRGQGLSDRLTAREQMGHVGHFRDYQQDLEALVADPRVGALPGPRLILGHSMGGVIALRALVPGAGADLGVCAGAILSAPMLGIAMPQPMKAAAGMVAWVGMALGRGERWPPIGKPDRPYVLEPFEGNVLTGDPELHSWLADTVRAEPRLGLGWPSIGWFTAATAEMDWLGRQPAPSDLPMLVLLGSDEKVIDADKVRTFAARIGAELAELPEGRHEVLIDRHDIRARAWQAIDVFLGRCGL